MVTYGRHPFIRLVSTYKDKVIDHIKFQHWREFVNYDPTHPYQVNFPNMLKHSIWFCGQYNPNLLYWPKTRCCDNSLTVSFWLTTK